MSYAPLPLAETQQSDKGNLSQHEQLDQPAQSPPERRFFHSANALHTAISVAAGTVMTLFGYE